jgi:molecular chaperone HtpG
MTDAELDELDKKMDEKKEEMKKTYEKFWGEFGKSIKSGLVEDVPNRKRLSEISRFYTTFNDTSL